jgi:hypothetical protein
MARLTLWTSYSTPRRAVCAFGAFGGILKTKKRYARRVGRGANVKDKDGQMDILNIVGQLIDIVFADQYTTARAFLGVALVALALARTIRVRV